MFALETRLFNLGMQVKALIGGPIPDNYDPMKDRDVIQFMETAVMAEIEFEQQQVAYLDQLDRELG